MESFDRYKSFFHADKTVFVVALTNGSNRPAAWSVSSELEAHKKLAAEYGQCLVMVTGLVNAEIALNDTNLNLSESVNRVLSAEVEKISEKLPGW